MENPVKSDDDYVHYLRQFEDAEDSTKEARDKCERDRDYKDGKQLTDTETQTLKDRGQPVVVFNEIQPKVNTMLGLEKQTRKDPKALPRNPDDEEAAAAATDAIRYVCEASGWDDKRSRAAENLVVEGTCAIMVGAKKAGAGLDPDIRRIAWDRFYYDPASSELDFDDALFKGIVIWMDLDDAVRKHPDAKDVLEGTWLNARDDSTFGDKPKGGRWADYKRRRVRLIEHYYNEGGWKFCILTGGGFVTKPVESPYMGDDGEPECPIKAVSLYIDRDNNRYGEVRMMVSPQDEVNKRRSKALWLISVSQVQALDSDVAMASDPSEVRKEAARPDGVLPPGWGKSPTSDMASGNLLLLQDAREHIHRTGANSALQGKDTQGQSGRAIIAQQQGGITESSNYLDAVRILSIAVYRSVWSRIRQYWDGERWIRVTDDKRNMRFVGLNRPVTMLDKLKKELGEAANDNPQAQLMLQQAQMDPMAQQVVGIENNVTQLDVDIIVDEGIDTPTIAAEQFSELVQLASTGMVQIPAEVLIEASSLRNKDKLLELMKQGPSPEQLQEQQEVKEIAKAGAVAEIENTQADTAKKTAEAQATQFGTMTDAYRAAASG